MTSAAARWMLPLRCMLQLPGSVAPDPPSHAYALWLAGQSVGVVILVAWIWTLLRERTASRNQIEKLSGLLLQAIENGWRERWKERDDAVLRIDSNQRNLLEAIKAIVLKRKGGHESG